MFLIGLLLGVIAVVLIVFATVGHRERLPLSRRRPGETDQTSNLSRLTRSTTTTIESTLARRGWGQKLADSLELAGSRLAPAEYVVMVASICGVAVLVGWLAAGLGGSLLFALLVLPGAWLVLRIRQGRRRVAFANQLDDTLQMLAGGLRAGHSLLRAIDAVSREAESPTAEEFARIVNEVRLGRDLGVALDSTAQRTGSIDFGWVAQAIAIHREAGGDLAEVLDEVGSTIRERNQIRRQVAALSAEGKMSAYVLMALPFVVLGILTITSPTYVSKFIESPIGWGLVAAAVIMLLIGGLWMRKVVSFKF
jgi:tight adherence protein B